jgi:hypothetical protein
METNGVSKFKRVCVFCGSSSGKKSYQDAAIELGNEWYILVISNNNDFPLHYVFFSFLREKILFIFCGWGENG